MKIDKNTAVVVTYNRCESLKKTVDCILRQTKKLSEIIIVDNGSTDDTEKFLHELACDNSNIIVERLNENLGGSGGFSKAIEMAYKRNADWIWGMDDDAYPTDDAFEVLCQVKDKLIKGDAYWSNPNRDIQFSKEYKSVDYLMFVGFFFSRNLIRTIGFPRNDLFIYYDDIEYSERIRKAGFEIYKVRDSIINHKDALSNKYRFKVLGTRLPSQAWRTYYFIRNEFLIYYNDKDKIKHIMLKSIRQIFKAVPMGYKVTKAVILAIHDGVLNYSGIRYRPK